MIEEKHINFLRKQSTFSPEEPRKSRRIFFFAAVVIILALFGGCLVVARMSSEAPLEYDPVTLEPKQPEGFFKKLSYLVFKKEITLEGEKKDRINILLLGMGGPGHDGPFLTDTIMIASIQPSTNEIALISIPRDLGVDIKGKGIYKINHANAFGEAEKSGWGGAYATEVIEDTFGIEIPYYIRLDFTAFEDIINEVGGVRVDVKNTFTDYEYPGPANTFQTVSFKSGPQTMDGKTALKYARSRHGNNGEGSDFARARRQQEILLALKEKILSFSTLTNPVRIKKIMDALEKNMTTNMQFDEIIEFAQMAREFNTSRINSLVLDSSPNGFLLNGMTAGGAFILSPATGNFDAINSAIQGIFESTATDSQVLSEKIEPPAENNPPPALDEEPTIEVQNGTWSAGLAARVKERLEKDSWYADTVGNIDPEIKPVTRSAVYVLSPLVAQAGQSIADALGITVETTLPSGIVRSASTTNILIILGEDFVE